MEIDRIIVGTVAELWLRTYEHTERTRVRIVRFEYVTGQI